MTPPPSLFARTLQPPAGRAWHGGATPSGALRGVTAETAYWRPSARRKSIWELTLHIAYWKYAVRRLLEGSERGAFPRRPSNWPAAPDRPTAASWRADVALLRNEHDQLVKAVARIDSHLLGKRPPGSRRWSYGELVIGIAMHDAYHTGQIQLMKRFWRERHLLR